MTAIRRNIEGASGEQGGQRSRDIVYRTEIAPKDLPSRLGVDDLPLIGVSSHPEDPFIIARRWSASNEGTGSLVTVTFATTSYGGGGLVYEIPETIGSKFYYGASIEIVDVAVPVAVREAIEITNGDLSYGLLTWVASEPAAVQESRMTITATWGLNSPDVNTFRTISEKNNKIHEIASSRWLFKVESITPKDNTNYDLNVSWTEDKGTRGFGLAASSDVALPGGGLDYVAGHEPAAIYPADPSLIRSPFHRLGLQPSLSPASDPPKVIQIKLYEDDLDGWVGLPGRPAGFP